MKPETKERKLIKYVKLFSDLTSTKKALSTAHINKYGSSCFFAKIKKGNKLILPSKMDSFIKNCGTNFICLLSDDSLDFVHNEFILKTPKKLIELFGEYYEEVYFIKLKKTIKIPKKAIKKLNIKTNDLVLVYIYNSGFIIKKLRETDIIL